MNLYYTGFLKNVFASRALLLFSILCLLMPPNILLAAAPKVFPGDSTIRDLGTLSPEELPHFFSAQFKGFDQAFEFIRVKGGYLVEGIRRHEPIFVSDSKLNNIALSNPEGERIGKGRASFTIQDGTGAAIPYGIKFDWDGFSDRFAAEVVLPDGSLRPLTLHLPGHQDQIQEGGQKALIVGVGLLLITCIAGSMSIDCAGECEDACGTNGVSSYDEGLCGTSCSCICL